MPQQQLLVLEGGGDFGKPHSVAGIADLDVDGTREVLVGLPGADVTFLQDGRALVLSGKSGEILREHVGWTEYARMGQFVHSAGDFDGDGTGDYAVVAMDAFGTIPAAGRVFIYSGATGAELASVQGQIQDRVLGEVFASAGDINGDGYDDVLISNGASPVYVFLGPDLTLARNHFLPGAYLSAAGLGDIDQDGYDDYVIGAPWDSTMGLAAGKAVVYSGIDGSVIHTVHGLQGAASGFNGDHLGRSVTGAGDWDLDGIPDFAAGAPAGVHFDLGEGFVRVYSGADASVLAHIVRQLPGSNRARFGDKVVGGHDLNADGYPDLLVGATRESSPVLQNWEGSATVISGKDGLVLWKVFGSGLHSDMGHHIDFVGDLDGDRHADFATADQHHDPGGIMIVYGGAPMGTDSYCPANPNSTGLGAHIYPEGHLKLRDDRFQVVLTQAVPGQSALLFYGAQVTDLPFGDGRMCIAPPHWRLAPPQATGPAGEAAFRLPLSQPPFSVGAGAMLPGSSWSFQVWYRDPASTGAGFNTSDALRVLWAPQ